MYIGIGVDRVKDRGKPVCPFIDTLLVGDQILPHLDQRMGEPGTMQCLNIVSLRRAPS